MKAFFFLSKKFGRSSGLSRPVRLMQRIVWCAVALSVAALVVSLSVANGFEQEYKKGLLDFSAHIRITPANGETLSEREIRRAFEEAAPSGVELLAILPNIYREALLIYQGHLKGVVLKGIASKHPKEKITLGAALAKTLGIEKAGEKVKLFIPKDKQMTSKNTKHIEVAGTFHLGLYEYDSQFALLDLETLRTLFGLSPAEVGYEIKLNRPEEAPRVALALESALGSKAFVQDWAALNKPLFQALHLEKWVFRFLMGLMVFVASLNLIGLVLLLIFRKKRTIAILRALGFDSAEIRRLFAWQGFLLGLKGIVAGSLLGLALVVALGHFHWIRLDPQIYFLERLPAHPDPLTIFIIALFSLLLVWQTSWLAAARAVTLPIREGLHGPE